MQTKRTYKLTFDNRLGEEQEWELLEEELDIELCGSVDAEGWEIEIRPLGSGDGNLPHLSDGWQDDSRHEVDPVHRVATICLDTEEWLRDMQPAAAACFLAEFILQH